MCLKTCCHVISCTREDYIHMYVWYISFFFFLQLPCSAFVDKRALLSLPGDECSSGFPWPWHECFSWVHRASFYLFWEFCTLDPRPLFLCHSKLLAHWPGTPWCVPLGTWSNHSTRSDECYRLSHTGHPPLAMACWLSMGGFVFRWWMSSEKQLRRCGLLRPKTFCRKSPRRTPLTHQKFLRIKQRGEHAWDFLN